MGSKEDIFKDKVVFPVFCICLRACLCACVCTRFSLKLEPVSLLCILSVPSVTQTLVDGGISDPGMQECERERGTRVGREREERIVLTMEMGR